MARNRIEELLVELKFKGGEELKKISGGFRELGKAVNLADADIEDARTKIIDYGKTLGNTNQAVKGTIQALKALQDSTQRGGEAWTQLSRDVLQFEQAARLTDREIESLRRGIVAEANAHSQSETSIRAHVRALQELRAQSVLGGQVNRQLSQTIGQLTQQLDQAEQASRAHFSALNQALAVRPDAVLRQWQAYTQILRDVRATAEQAAEAQQRLNQLAGAPRISARRELVARAGIQADPAYQERFGLGGRSLEALPDVPAALSLRLRELQEDLNFTTRNTGLYIRTLVEMAAVQRQASATTQGFAAALREQLASGELPRTQKNLQEVIGALRREMVELDTSTATGSRAYAENAAQVRVLERELNQLANSYRNVADMAVQAATAERSAATARVTALYMNNRAVRDQAQAMSELGNAVRSGIAGTPLMLPAAGQTTAPGSGLQFSGGAIPGLPSGNIQKVLTPGAFPGELQQGPEISPEQADAARRAYLSTAEAARVKAEAEQMAAESSMRLRAEVDKARQANDGSINSIERYRDSLVTLRNTLPATGGEFKKFSSQVERLDAQLERAQRRRRRMSAMEATQAAGAVISGGIFGGPEGAIGGAIGTAVGGVPGAFAGAAIGAQVGAIRQAIGSYAEMSAEINRLRQGLAASSNNFTEFTSLVRTTEESSKRLLIPLADSYRIMAQLRANTVELGYSLEDTKMLFEGTATAVFQTGGNLNDVQGAMRAIVQVLSKGRPQAEEIRSQLGERLPGAIIKFAQETGRSTEELEQAFKDSKVTVDEFFKFAKRNFKDGESYYDSLATSAENAGRRYQKALETTQLSIGRTFESTGAIIQDAAAAGLEGLNSLATAALELGLIQSPSYYFEQLVTGSLKVEEAEKRLVKLKAAADEFDFSLGLRTFLGGDPGPELRALEDALKRLRKFQDSTKERETEQEKEAKKQEQEQQAQSFLQAVEQREDAIAQARIQLEEQAAQIREQAIEGVAQIERDLANSRRDMEREIARIARQRTDEAEDIQRRIRIARGEDSGLVEAEQQIADIAREARDARLELEQRLADDEENQAQVIADFQKNVAKQIRDANEAHTKRVGEIQTTYAKQVTKIIDEATGKAAKRLVSAGELLALMLERATLQDVRAGYGFGPVPSPQRTKAGLAYPGFAPSEVPDQFKDLDKRILDLERKLRSQRIDDQFMAMLQAEGGFEDIAGLQPLPVKRMLDQAARPFQQLWRQIGDASNTYYEYGQREIRGLLKPNPTRSRQVLERIQRVEQVRQNWSPLEAESRARLNRTNPNPRSRPSAISISAFSSILDRMTQDMLGKTLSSMSWSGGVVKGDLSGYLTEQQRQVIRSGVKDLINVYGGEFLESISRGSYRSAIKEAIELEGGKLKPRAGAPSQALTPIGGDTEWLQRFMEQTEPPRVVPGVGSRIEGAFMPRAKDFGEYAAASFAQGVISDQQLNTWISNIPMSQQVDTPSTAIPSAGATTQTRERLRQEGLEAINAVEIDKVRAAFAEVNQEASSYSANLKNQIDLTRVQAEYIAKGFSEDKARAFAEIELGYVKARDELLRKALATRREGILTESQLLEIYNAELLNLDQAYGLNVQLTEQYQQQLELFEMMQRSPRLVITDAIRETRKELNNLTNAGNQVVGGATAIGDAFGDAFKGVITGSVSAKEALAGFFSSVAEYFADMAAKMIAEWIKLAILNTIVRIFNPAAGAAAGGAGLSDLSAPASINNPLGVLNANGNAFAQNGIVPYAKGGIVNSPTLFKFARGSAMATGVMGEAGPEAIMPLKRGPDGKLGVAGGGSGATTVNVSVDAKGTQVQGDSAQGAALGRVIAGAVQAELIKQQRPGGLLSGGR